jgi:AraC-like DNA-binding protein
MMTDHTPKMPDCGRPDLTGAALTYRSGARIAPHAHPAGQLIHAISGAMRVSAQGALWMLPVGRALWIPAGIEHAIRCEGEVRMRTAYVSPACRSAPAAVQLIAVSALARELLVRLAEGAGDRLRLVLGELLLHEIAAGSVAPFRLPIPTDPRLARLAEALRADPASQATIRDWARTLGFSERSLIRRIRNETGMTFRELRRQTRVMIAMERLAEGRSVTAAAFDVGFETPSAFIHAFRTVTGRTPRRFLIGD